MMDIRASKADLNKALQITLSAVARRTTMPILSNILLSSSNSELKISASDLEVTAVATIKAEVKSAGSTTVNARVFSDIIRELPEGEVHISLKEGERIEVSAKNSKFKIVGISADEYPSLPGAGLKVKATLKASQLLEMINKTLYAVSHDETRFNLNGVCFETIDSKGAKKGSKHGSGEQLLRMVATDGHRLAMVTRPVDDLVIPQKVIVPKRGLAEVRKILDAEGDNNVKVDIQEGFFLLETADCRVSMRLIDGEYPDCSQVIPKDKGVVATLNSGELSQALRRVMLMVTDREKCVRMNFGHDVLRISSSSPELGEAYEEVCVKYSGDVLVMGFNAAYVLEVMASFGELKNICIELHGELGPGKFFEEEDESSLAIVMPMRL